VKVRLTNNEGFYKDLFQGPKSEVKEFLAGLKAARELDSTQKTFESGLTLGLELQTKSEPYRQGYIAFLSIDMDGGKIEVVE